MHSNVGVGTRFTFSIPIQNNNDNNIENLEVSKINENSINYMNSCNSVYTEDYLNSN